MATGGAIESRGAVCRDCHRPLPRVARFCPHCGGLRAGRAPTAGAPSGWRRTRAAGGVDGGTVGGRRRSRPVRAIGAALGAVGVGVWAATIVSGGALVGDEREQAANQVELPAPDRTERRSTTADDAAGDTEESDRPQAARSLPPPCLDADSSRCAAPVVDDTGLRDAVRVAFGVVTVDESLELQRLQLIRDGSSVRWRAQAWVGADDGPRDPTPTRLERTGTTLLLGTPGHLQAIDTITGEQQWAADLSRFGDEVTPWRGWIVDDAVVAVTQAGMVVLDTDDGRIRWASPGPFRDVLPLASGVAVIRAGRLEMFGVDDERPVWGRPLEPTARFPAGRRTPSHGPIVVVGREPGLYDPGTGAELADLDGTAVATRATGGSVVAAVWEDDGGPSQLIGFGSDGEQRFRVEGPGVACCHLQLRPTADGNVLVLFAGRVGEETGWIVDPASGVIRHRVVRPGDVAWVPREVVGATIVWMDGTAFLGADPDGTLSWRAESEVRLITATPPLLATRDGLIRPPAPTVETSTSTAALRPAR